jgi:hypothetical protein
VKRNALSRAIGLAFAMHPLYSVDADIMWNRWVKGEPL